MARSAGPLALATTPFILAQKEAFRPASALVLGLGAGGLSLEPVAALYLARPLAVSPAPFDAGSFSPRPTESDTDLGMLLVEVHQYKSISSVSTVPASICAKVA